MEAKTENKKNTDGFNTMNDIDIEFEIPNGINKIKKIDDICGDKNIFIRGCFDRAEALFSIIIGGFNIDNFSLGDKAKDELYLSLIGLNIELYLKTILYFEKTDTELIKGNHDLKKLYNKLSAKSKKSILERCGLVGLGNVDNNLEKNKSVFIDFRYGFELNGYTVSIGFLCKFLKVIKLYAEELITKL